MNRPPSFDAIAPFYLPIERLAYGPVLHRCRTAHLDRIQDCRRALILGDGDGRFLAELLSSYHQIQVDSIDLSPGMLALARARIAGMAGASERIQLLQGDARTCPWPASRYDLIVTNFFLDCFTATDLANVIARVAAVTGPGTLWIDGDFRLPPGRWLRPVAQTLLVTMYLFFQITTGLRTRKLIEPAHYLAAHGFKRVSERCGLWGFLSSRLWVRGENAIAAGSSDLAAVQDFA